MQPERDTGAYETPNLKALDAELDRRIEAVLERKLANPAFVRMLSRRINQQTSAALRQSVHPTMNEER